MARERLTDRGYDPKTGSTGKTADPYLMNQERRPESEPSATQYESGDPSSWAEDVNPDDIWKQEYQKGRDEIGMGNFLDSTWKDREHPGTPGAPAPTYENRTAGEDTVGDVALRQAAEERAAKMAGAKLVAHKALHLAHAMFPKAGEDFVMAQARDFMMMPESHLDATIARIIGAGEVPEAFKKQWKKNKGDDKDDDKKEDKEASVDDRLATLKTTLATIKGGLTAGEEEEEEEEGDKEAQLQMIANLEERIATLETRNAGEEMEEEEEEADKDSSVEDRLVALTAGLEVLNGTTAGEEEEEEEADKDSSEAAVTAGEEEEKEKMEEEEEADKESSTLNELDIELTSPEMNTTAGDGDMLDDIFVAAQNKTAAEKPKKKGVSTLGGGSKTAKTAGLDDLSALWKSDPDVSADFR